MEFNDLGLSKPIVSAVTAEGYTNPTPIQARAIPTVLAGNDLLGSAQTGTGKTGAFALPILHRLASAPVPNGRTRRGRGDGRPPRALVLCPTRELASQIHDSFQTYGRNLPLRHCVVFGGVNQARQVRSLRAGIDVLVATPGRLQDLMNQGFVDLRAIEMLVLDEADRMLDMGFIHDIRKIIARVPTSRQTLLFSATMPGEIRRLIDSILHDPVTVEVAPVATTVEAIAQWVYMVARNNKPILLERLLRRNDTKRTLVFTRTKYGADKLVKRLRRSGINADAIHGNKTQNARTRTLNSFKSGKMNVLIATDIASRGIDVDEITHVFNFDLPNDPETYVHRIGRTARAGASGIAVSFCDHDELNDLRAIERLTRVQPEIASDESDLTLDISLNDLKGGQRRRASNSGPRKPRRRRGPAPGRRPRQAAGAGSR